MNLSLINAIVNRECQAYWYVSPTKRTEKGDGHMIRALPLGNPLTAGLGKLLGTIGHQFGILLLGPLILGPPSSSSASTRQAPFRRPDGSGGVRIWDLPGTEASTENAELELGGPRVGCSRGGCPKGFIFGDGLPSFFWGVASAMSGRLDSFSLDFSLKVVDQGENCPNIWSNLPQCGLISRISDLARENAELELGGPRLGGSRG